MSVANLALQSTEIEGLAAEWQHGRPEDILRIALERVPSIALACSFGAEDMVLLDMLMKLNPETEVFYLDTDLLFPETYALIEQAKARYGIPNLRQIRPSLTVAEQAEQYGDALWERDPNLCCNLRKVQSLTTVLAGLDGWITGIRRDQAPTRANTQVFEVDQKFGLVKVNPLAFWTWDQVWAYIREHEVPYNALQDEGYPSIGCVHCTRPVRPGEDLRAGRWAGFEKTECGLHR
ncbi:phosphoadenosine phosphosulfate reductase [Alicyclobacillus macrosporangiidus]|uniref:Adenosine 5'-phosphosulfate reductase n=1 Tax=Alicyclobacillus macrosporangiidus TaxID=392015 RepID=A0A1I7HEQ4_9BACL|nr:phosphoadenosine phosphosulfate reductase [Alicyclobacillus macrosporangiidus]